jgi:biopolymer transport protein ExbD
VSRKIALSGVQELPHFGIFGSIGVFCAVVGVWVATAIGNPESKGFHVRLLRPIAQKQAFDPWLQPIVIRVDAEARYYLDGNAIPVRRIPKALTAFFKTRANRTVYIDGDLDSNFGDVVEAADAVRHAGGQIVLLTPTRP